MIAADPSEQFLTAYQAYQQGEKLERSGSTSDALKKFHFAESLLLSISRNDPTWQKPVVEYRLKKTREGIARLGGASEGGGSDAASSTPAETSETPAEVPQESSGGPSISITPPTGAPSQNAGGSRQSSSEVRRLRRQIEVLKGELQQERSAVASAKNRSNELENAEWVKMRSDLNAQLDVANRKISDLQRDLNARSSWDKDLKALQKKLDEAIADKTASEEQFQERSRKAARENATLWVQLRDERAKSSADSGQNKQIEQLNLQLRKSKEELQKFRVKLDEAVADKFAVEEKLAEVTRKASESNALLLKQVAELQQSLRESAEAGQRLEQLSKAVETGKSEMEQMRSKVEISERQLKDSASKGEELQKQLAEANARLAAIQKQAEQVAPLKQSLEDLQERLKNANSEVLKARAKADEDAKAARVAAEEKSKRIKASEADKAALEEERQQLVSKLEAASLAAKEASKVKGLEAESAALKKSVEELQGRVKAADAELLNARAKAGEDAKAARVALEEQSKRSKAAEAGKAALEEERQQLVSKLEAASLAAKEASKVKGLEAESAALKKSVEELQGRVKAADAELLKARAKADEDAKAARVAAEEQSKKTKAAEADKAALQEERKALISKLDQATVTLASLGGKASKVGPLEKEVGELNAKLAKNAAEMEQAASKIAAEEQRAKEVQAEARRKSAADSELRGLLEQQNASLQQQLKASVARMAAVVDHGKDENLLREQTKKLEEQIEENAKSLAEARQNLSALSKAQPEQQKILAEKEKALAEAMADARKLREDLSAATQKISSLQQDAVSNRERLAELQEQFSELSKSGPERERLLAEREKALTEARKDADKLRQELSDSGKKITLLQKDGSEGKDRLKELQERLAAKESEIAALKLKKGKGSADAATTEEVGLLKGIVLREIKEEAKRSQARRLMAEELKRLNVQSRALDEQMGILTAPVLVLTPQEKALFKDSQLSVVEGEGEKIKASVAAPLNVPGGNTGQGTDASSVMPKEAPPAGKASPANAQTTASASPEEAPWQGKFKELIARAKEEFDHQDYIRAEESFSQALKLSPDDYFTLSNLGVVQFQLGKMKEAEISLSKASEKSSDSSFALTTLGIVHYRQERLADAEKVLRRSIGINSQDFTAHNYLGIVLAASGKPKAGEGEILKAIEINPRYADAHFNIAVIYATGKPPAKMMARKHYAKAVELGAPPDPSLENLIK